MLIERVAAISSAVRPLNHHRASSELVRDFLHRILYEQDHGYFNCAHRVGAPLASIYSDDEWLRRLRGEIEYKQRVQSVYEGLKTGWMTPCELFQPFYSRVLVQWIVSELKTRPASSPSRGWELIEIGGGQGTNSVNILNELRAKYPDHYESLRSYSLVDASEKLVADQRLKIYLHRHQHKCRVVHASAADLPPPLVPEDLCIVIGLEVLDNMVHDRVENWLSDNPLETLVDPSNRCEALRPVDDSLIMRCLEVQRRTPLAMSSLEKRLLSSVQYLFSCLEHGHEYTRRENSTIWLPTTCLAFLDRIEEVIPNHTILLADFDSLPCSIDQSIRAPIVAQQVDGITIDSNTYRVPVGCADVFFPTDFALLSALYSYAVTDGIPKYSRSREFMVEYASQEILDSTTTKSGYNPMLDDYVNTSVFIGKRAK